MRNIGVEVRGGAAGAVRGLLKFTNSKIRFMGHRAAAGGDMHVPFTPARAEVALKTEVFIDQ